MTADRFIMGGMPDNDYHDAMEKRLAAPTEQTEAQDDKEVTPLYSAIITDMCDEIESLRAQLEAARGEIDTIKELCGAMAEKRFSVAHGYTLIDFLRLWHQQEKDAADALRADQAQKMQEHQDALSEMRGRMEGAARDAARLDWLEARKSADTTFCAPGMHGGDDPTVWLVAVETTRDKYGGICYNYYGPTLRAAIDAALSPPSAGAV